jgi:hypothetical protein
MRTPTLFRLASGATRLAAFGAVALAASGALLAAGSPAAAGEAGPKTVLHLIEKTVSIQFTDKGDPGPSVGDVITYANSLGDAGSGKALGTKNGTCQTAYVGGNGHLYAACVEKLSLKAGRITAAGFVDQTSLSSGAAQTLAAGGTSGAYKGLSGTEVYHASHYPDEFTTTITLR